MGGAVALALVVACATGAGAATAAPGGPTAPAGPGPAATAPAATDADAPDGDDVEVIAPPSRRRGATVARIVVPTRARPVLRRADRATRVAATTAWAGHDQILLVLAAARHGGRDWVRVALPQRPNRSSGWVPRDHVELSTTRWWIDVHLSTRTVTAYREGRARRRWKAVVGASRTPTPTGLFAVWEHNRQRRATGFVGSWVLSITALSDVLEDYGGGPGRVALHGRGGASLRDPLGSARSHGCIRLDNRAIAWIAHRVPAGAPVRIRR
ncbi:MAG: L,D-transpeptidase [Solirubrobacteraceae bacterium]|nr:L,D-transpeptidase [Solirubrobacteraceae bacterium]